MLTVPRPEKFDWAGLSLKDCAYGNALDAYWTLRLFEQLEGELDDLDIIKLHENLLSDIIPAFANMEFKGLDVSEKRLDNLDEQLQYEISDVKDTLRELEKVSEEMNFASNKELIDLLYLNEEGFGLYPPKKTAKGNPSVDKATLEILLEQITNELDHRSKI